MIAKRQLEKLYLQDGKSMQDIALDLNCSLRRPGLVRVVSVQSSRMLPHPEARDATRTQRKCF